MPVSQRPVIYVPGAPIDTRRPLEVRNVPSGQWGPIAEAYPEVAAAGSQASFHGKRNTTIFPPTTMGVRALRRLVHFGGVDRTVYQRQLNGRLVGVLIHVHGSRDGYDSVHIYRLAASEMSRKSRWRRQ